MKIWMCLILIIFVASAQDNGSSSQLHPVQPLPQDPVTEVGGVISGQLDPQNTETNLHNIRVRDLEKKYLFIRASAEDTSPVNIGFYSNTTRNLVHSCFQSTFDSCYIPKEKINPNEVYVILIAGKTKFRYLLYTYWGDIEHLNPGQQIKFSFQQANPTQLFHLDLDQNQNYQQVRLVLRPETARDPNDKLKIFVNKGFDFTPTEEKHDYQSVHVWGDSEAIFLTKKQIGNATGLNVFIAGSSTTIYLFKCEVITKDHHDIAINETIHEFIDNEETQVYHIDFSTDQTVDIYAVKASLFSGEILVGFYEDKQMNKPYRNEPLQYMSDIEFIFTKQELPSKDIYMMIKCPDSSAVYLINVQGRVRGKAFEISQNIFQFLPVVKNEGVFFYHHQMKSEISTLFQNNFIFEINAIPVQGTIALDFYVCKTSSDEESCKDFSSENLKNVADRLTAEKQQVGMKSLYRVEVNRSYLQQINSMEERIMVVCVLRQQKSSEGGGLIALQYSNPNKIRILREERAFEDRVLMQETKYYKYINNDPNVFNLKIFFSEISGLTQVKVQRTDFREKSNSNTQVKPISNDKSFFVVSDSITEPIYISVTGLVNSLFTLSISSTHQDHPISSAMTLAEDIEYELKILPYQFINVEIHPIESEVAFEYSVEGGQVAICQLDSQGLCVKGSNNEANVELGSKGRINIDSSGVRSIKYRIGNYVNVTNNSRPYQYSDMNAPKNIVKTVRVKVIYHSVKEKHCQMRKINYIYSEVAETGKCLKFLLPLVSDIEIFQARQDIGSSFSMYFICDSKITPTFSNERLKINGSEIADKCKATPNDLYIIMVVADISPSIHNDIRMDYSVEYRNDTITLADGVGYHTQGRSIEGALRTFFYEVLDTTLPTEITLLNQKGIQKFFIDVSTDSSKKYNAVVESRALLTSKDSNFYSNPTVAVTPDIYQKEGCKQNCVIIISVYSTEKVGKDVEYTIEATQREYILKQDAVRKDFLPKNSVNYYKYEVRNDKADLMVTTSDNGRSCEIIYLSKSPYPSASNYFMMETLGVLINKNSEKGMYYLAIEATEDCEYSISVSENNASLTKLDYGQYYDLNLKEGEGKWFYTHHSANSNFKILSLLKSGGLQIYANQTSLDKNDLDTIMKKNIEYSKFSFKTGYKNTLVVKNDQEGFCSDCHYIIYVKATKPTQSTIWLGDENSKVSLEKGKVYYDEFDTLNTISMATFYKVSSGKILIKVHSGDIKVELEYHDQKWEKEFSTDPKIYHQTYNFTKHEDNYDPISIRVTPVTVPTYYSYELVPDVQEAQDSYKVNPGEHTYLFLQNGDQSCLIGFINTKNEEIFITVDADQTLSLGELSINASLNGEKTEKYETQVVGNILSIKFVFDSVFFTQAVPYRICFSTNDSSQSLALMAFQNAKVNLIHSDTEVLVRNESTFVMYPRGDIIVDVFECKGKANVFYSSSEEKLENSSSKDLDVIGIPGQSHAIKIEEFSSLYVKVKAEKATLVWTPLNPEKERGVGYFKYNIGNIQYSSKFNKIDFLLGSVFQQKETQTVVRSIRYILYISNDIDLLQSAVMCEQSNRDQVLHYRSIVHEAGKTSNSKITISVSKKQITEKFGKNDTLFYNAVADLTLMPPESKDEEHYRFVYFSQQVPADVFRQNKLENMQIGLLIVLVFVSVAGLIVVAFVFVKWVVPAIGLLKNRIMLTEQKEDNEKDQSIPVPPSSDRNQIGTNNLQNDVDLPPQTEDQMN